MKRVCKAQGRLSDIAEFNIFKESRNQFHYPTLAVCFPKGYFKEYTRSVVLGFRSFAEWRDPGFQTEMIKTY